ncbi:GTP pyrophosphokinase [Geodia barretti]|uniref:Putative GTP diphosphokinase RSH1, chloroplastic n=1 Tax=Geodia barretti TaxID=519541 RepID=A0AA35TZJ2_GEOBA|nr:GTP pyrophosphokinase [Geodia barretti]
MRYGVEVKEANELLDKVSRYLPDDAVAQIEQAYLYADECHDGQVRKSGEPYIIHPLQAAAFLADLNLDCHTICAALLHDVIEDCAVTFDDIEKAFGREVAKMVDGVTKLTRMDYRLPGAEFNTVDPSDDPDKLHAESLRKMLVAMAEDIRVVLIKLADRLHNMKTLDALPPAKRKIIAQETLDIYSPLAHRLGIWEIKWQLDDLAFRHLNEDRYREISRMLAVRRAEREEYVEQLCQRLREMLAEADLQVEVYGRPKGIYSIYNKMQKYAAQGDELRDILDLYAVRVIVDSETDCYRALGIVHQVWSPIPGQFDDYVANPKENMYQALHTTVICQAGQPLEVQIKTTEMHQVSEYGVAAHWRYKEGRANDLKFEEKMTWLRQLLEWQRDAAETEDFIESVQQDIFRDQVFVYTPKGEIVELAAGCTPVDFAYKIHTDLGHHCMGGKVNGRLVSLDTPLQNGDTVEIMTTKANRGPSLDWLNPNLGYVKSASARQKVRQWFNHQARGSNIERGRDKLRKELRLLNLKLDDSEILNLVRFETMDDFLLNLGSGGLTDGQLAHRLSQAARQEPEFPLPKPNLPLSSPSSGISVLGVGDLLSRIARCCNPIPGDEISGFVTRTRGVTVHKKDCISLINEDEPERIVHVSWGEAKELYPVRVCIDAYDRVGLLRDVTVRVSEERVNIASVVTQEKSDGTVIMELTLHTTGLEQLGQLFAKLEGVKGVTSVTRAHTPTAVKV